MLNIIILSIAAAILIGLNKDEVKQLIKRLFDTIVSCTEIFGTVCNNLKQRQQLPPPFNLSLLRSLAGVIGYGLLCAGMTWCIYANVGILKTRFEASMPFSYDTTLFALPVVLAMLVTFVETIFFFLLEMPDTGYDSRFLSSAFFIASTAAFWPVQISKERAP